MKCACIKSDGIKCNANAMKGFDLCFTHNPASKEEKAIAVKKGGLNRKHYESYGDSMQIKTPEDVKALLSQVINGVWTGAIPANQPANTITM